MRACVRACVCVCVCACVCVCVCVAVWHVYAIRTLRTSVRLSQMSIANTATHTSQQEGEGVGTEERESAGAFPVQTEASIVNRVASVQCRCRCRCRSGVLWVGVMIVCAV